MYLCNIRYKKHIIALVIFLIFLSSVCAFSNDSYPQKGIDAASTRNELSTCASDIDDIMYFEVHTLSKLNMGLLRQASLRRGSYNAAHYSVYSLPLSTYIIGASLLFSYIQMKDIENSHKYTIHYIHQKDGLKK